MWTLISGEFSMHSSQGMGQVGNPLYDPETMRSYHTLHTNVLKEIDFQEYIVLTRGHVDGPLRT